jgi:signal transduction histidine kinase/ligand-binding sensor domain-containing protein
MTDAKSPTRSARGPLASWVAVLFLLWSPGTWALNPDARLVDLVHSVWDEKEGAPTGGVDSAVQTKDGYLWVASGGLFRFDGRRFEHIELPRSDQLSSMFIYQLFAPRSGGLWIGFTYGGAAFLKDGHLTVYTEREGLPAGSVKDFAQDLDGTLWVATTRGLAHLGPAGWQRLGADSSIAFPDPDTLIVDSQGTLWISCAGRVLFLQKGENRLQEYTENIKGHSSVAESQSGVIWLRDEEGFRPIRKIENPDGRAIYSTRQGIYTTRQGVLIDHDGGIWLADSPYGVRRIPRLAIPPGQPMIRSTDITDLYTVHDGMTSAAVRAMFEDHEGNVWIGTVKGLERFSERNVMRELVAPEQGIAAADGGGVWVTSQPPGTPISIADKGRLIRSFPAHDIDIECVFRADDGSVWFGGPKDLWQYSQGWSGPIALPSIAGGAGVQAMAHDRSGALWVSIVRKGVFRLTHGAWSEYGDLPELPKLTAITISADTNGRVWFGYTENRIALVDGNHVQLFTPKEGLQIGNVTAIYGRRSKLWAGGEFGLAVFDGQRFRALIPDATSSLNGITGIVETADGDLWLSASSGIVHIGAAEIRRAIEEPSSAVHGETFGPLDGLEGLGVPVRPHPTAVEGTDGRLWFATNVAVFSIDPRHLIRNSIAPPVVITSVRVGDQTYLPTDGLQLPEQSTALRIDYIGLSLTIPQKVRYRYKLDGVNPDWQDAQGRNEAYFINVRPGTYRFHVTASNSDGVWNDTGATLSFVIPRTFTQTPWFLILCVAASGALMWLVFRIRVRQVAARMRLRLNERLRERERIARELHDTLLQSTQGLMLRVQAAANRVLPADPAREMLDKALSRADEVLAEARDRVQDLRIPLETRSDLAQSLAAVGDELALGRHVAFRVIVEGPPIKLRTKIIEEVYCIGREALLNAFHHAQATSIELLIVYGNTDLRVRVRDDGCGVDPSILEGGARAGHWGLKGMRERAHEIGARLEIRSHPAAGTEIEVSVPSVLAQRRRPWSRLWPRPRQKEGGQ